MKTWDQAKTIHKARLAWCARLSEALITLEQAGAPPPDDVCAAHADWAIDKGRLVDGEGKPVGGILRVGMTLDNALHISGNRRLFDVLGLKTTKVETGDQLADAMTLWADILRRYSGGTDARDVVTTSAMGAVNTTYPLDNDDAAERLNETLLEQRHRPYHSPGLISDEQLAKRIAKQVMHAWSSTNPRNNADLYTVWQKAEAAALAVLDEERKAGRRT